MPSCFLCIHLNLLSLHVQQFFSWGGSKDNYYNIFCWERVKPAFLENLHRNNSHLQPPIWQNFLVPLWIITSSFLLHWSTGTPRGQVHPLGKYTPQAGTPPWAGTPPAGTPPAGTPQSRYTPLGRHTPLGRYTIMGRYTFHDGHCSRRHASYWNAFLFDQ